MGANTRTTLITPGNNIVPLTANDFSNGGPDPSAVEGADVGVPQEHQTLITWPTASACAPHKALPHPHRFDDAT